MTVVQADLLPLASSFPASLPPSTPHFQHGLPHTTVFSLSQTVIHSPKTYGVSTLGQKMLQCCPCKSGKELGEGETNRIAVIWGGFLVEVALPPDLQGPALASLQLQVQLLPASQS